MSKLLLPIWKKICTKRGDIELKSINLEKNDDVVVVNQNQHLLQEKIKLSIDVSYPIYQKIDSYLFKKYPNTDLDFKDILKENDYIFSLGIEKAEKELECSILFEEKKPRKDVLQNLGKLAQEFLLLPDYPNIKAMAVTKTINKVIGFRDKRTKEKYEKCVHQYIGKPGDFAIIDVSGFVERIPNEFLNTTSSTSSFGEKI